MVFTKDFSDCKLGCAVYSLGDPPDIFPDEAEKHKQRAKQQAEIGHHGGIARESDDAGEFGKQDPQCEKPGSGRQSQSCKKHEAQRCNGEVEKQVGRQ